MRLEEVKEIRIALPKEIYNRVERIATEKGLNTEEAVGLLLEAALDVWEDEVLTEMAIERIQKYDPRRTLSDEEIWD